MSILMEYLPAVITDTAIELRDTTKFEWCAVSLVLFIAFYITDNPHVNTWINTHIRLANHHDTTGSTLTYNALITYINSTVHSAIVSIFVCLYLFGVISDEYGLKPVVHFSMGYFIIDTFYIVFHYLEEYMHCPKEYEAATHARTLAKLHRETRNFLLHHFLVLSTYLITHYNIDLFSGSEHIINNGTCKHTHALGVDGGGGAVANGYDYRFSSVYDGLICASTVLKYERYIMARFMLAEITIPFLNIWVVMCNTVLNGTAIHKYIGMLTVVTYFGFRVVNMAMLLYQFIALGYINGVVIMAPMFWLNIMWFLKICKRSAKN